MACTKYFNCNLNLANQVLDVIDTVGKKCVTLQNEEKCGQYPAQSNKWFECVASVCKNSCFSTMVKGIAQGDEYKATLSAVHCPPKILTPPFRGLTPAWAPEVPAWRQLTPGVAPLSPGFAPLTPGVGTLTPAWAGLTVGKSDACSKYFDCNKHISGQEYPVAAQIALACSQNSNVREHCGNNPQKPGWSICAAKYCGNKCFSCFVKNGSQPDKLGNCVICPLEPDTPAWRRLVPGWVDLTPAERKLKKGVGVLTPAWAGLTPAERKLKKGVGVLTPGRKIKPDRPLVVFDKPITPSGIYRREYPSIFQVIIGVGCLLLLLYLLYFTRN